MMESYTMREERRFSVIREDQDLEDQGEDEEVEIWFVSIFIDLNYHKEKEDEEVEIWCVSIFYHELS